MILVRGFNICLLHDIFDGFVGNVFSRVGDGNFTFFSRVLKMVMAARGFIEVPTIII